MVATHTRLHVVQAVLRGLPVPASLIPVLLKGFGVRLESLPKPLMCRDRWDRFSIAIEEPTDAIQKHILLRGFFEYYETEMVRRLLKPGDLFLDIGANIGWYTLLASSIVGEGGRVLAFEPAKAAYHALERNIALNGFKQVRLFNEALGVRPGSAHLYAHETGEAGANTMFSGPAGAPIEAISVRTGDGALDAAGVDRVDFCKIDVEGAECDVLKGLSNTLGQKRISRALVECNSEALKRAGTAPEELFDLLRAAGFRICDVRAPRKAITRASDLPSFCNLLCLQPGGSPS